MKRLFKTAVLAASTLALGTAALAIEPEERDPGVTAIIESLSQQFEEATGQPLDEKTKGEYRISLVHSLVQNIRDGSCREVIYGVHKDGVDMRVHEDICRIDDNFVLAPPELRVMP